MGGRQLIMIGVAATCWKPETLKNPYKTTWTGNPKPLNQNPSATKKRRDLQDTNGTGQAPVTWPETPSSLN